MTARRRVAVAGGGIAGLATAIALRRDGWDVTVYERAAALSTVGAALGVHSHAVLALRALGLDGSVLAAGEEVLRWEFRNWHGRLLATWPQTEISAAVGAPGITVPRSALQSALLGAVPADVLRVGWELTGFRRTDDGVELRFADGQRATCDLLVGADGLRSVVRTGLRGVEPPAYAGFVAWRGVCPRRPASLPSGLARQTLGAAVTFGTWSLPGDNTYWVATLSGPDGGDIDPANVHRLLTRVFGRAHQPIPELIEATPAEAILRTPIYHRQPSPGWHDGSVVLVGDAAHAMLPTTGVGGSHALLDALALAESLGRLTDLGNRDAVAAALTAFEGRRLPVVSAVAAEARRIGEMHHEPSLFKRMRRDRDMRRTPEHEWIRRMSHRSAPPVKQGGPR